MAWRFRLGSRREENGGTGVQVVEALPEETSQNVATEEAVASASTSKSTTEAAEGYALGATVESPKITAVTEEATKDESTQIAAQPESQISLNSAVVTQATDATDAPTTSESSAETT